MRGRPRTAEIDGRLMLPNHCFPRRRVRPLSSLAWRLRRGYSNTKRLRYEVSVLAVVHGAIRLGIEQELCQRLAQAGLGEDAVTAVRFHAWDVVYDVIVPTYRTWTHPRLHGIALSVGLRVPAHRHLTLIAPPAEIQAEPRLGNAHRIFHDKLVPIRGDAGSAIRCIEEHGGQASLVACETALGSPFAKERIFGLVFGGYLEIDLTAEIAEQSIVRIGRDTESFDWAGLGWRMLANDEQDPSNSIEATAVPLYQR